MVFNRYNKSEGFHFLRRLCEQFEKNITRYKSPSYDEADARQDLIERLFLSLGWDVHNEQGASPLYKEMKFEGKVLVKEEGRETVKNPDLDFKMGPKTMFYVEIKPPHIRVPDAPSAFQLRRYAWSKKGLPVSILTNFENFCVYDTRYKPDINDSPRVALVHEINHKDYVKEFDYLWNTFSYEAVRGGSIEKFAEETKDKRGHTDVDDAFLKDIENFRYLLAKNIALRNPWASPINIYQLNDIVQKVIDRIVFLRVCEDRDIEQYGTLKDIVDEGSDIYERLMVYFGRAENRYNAGLFNLREDPHKTSPHIVIDDVVLSEIINSLYYPDSPYAFAAIPVEILGQVYERFLGKTIRLTPSHQVKVEYKPEVRKAGGIYYTPKYIVDYIVENTVGRLLEGKKPSQVKKIRILDPACGSGSFLLGAYDYILRWHLERYIEDLDKYLDKTIYKTGQRGDDEFHLTIDERKRILMEHIFGVDIDPQAVEVTKLSLHLKVLEGETGETLDGQLALIREPALPDLERNIRCGNSLIGPDFYKQFDIGLFDDDEIRRINVFDWNDDKNGFGEIMRDGWFDVVIGNPPWVSLTGRFRNEILNDDELKYLIYKYKGKKYMPNIYEYFVKKGLMLIKKGGFHSFIIPDRLGFNEQYKELRKEILYNYSIESLKYKVKFPNVVVDTLIYIISNNKPRNKIFISVDEKENIEVDLKLLMEDDLYTFPYFDSLEIMDLISKIKENKDLKFIEDICYTTSGFGGKSKLITRNKISENQIKTIKGENVLRYILKGNYYFEFNKINITGRTVDKNKLGSKQKILIRKTGNKIIGTYDESEIFPEQSVYFLYNNKTNMNFKYILGLLNSKLINFIYLFSLVTNRETISQLKKIHLDKIPIYYIDFNNPGDVKMHDEMVHLVERMMDLKKRYYKVEDVQLRTQLDHAIKATDDQIDQLVYKLYNLTDEDIRVVEGNIK